MPLEDDIKQNSSAIDGLAGRIAKLEGADSINRLTERVSALEAREIPDMTGLGERLSKLEGRLDGRGQQFNTIMTIVSLIIASVAAGAVLITSLTGGS